jgi:hypothetical protein
MQGVWRARQIPNPAYKGEWEATKIPNPDYFEDANPFSSLTPIAAAGMPTRHHRVTRSGSTEPLSQSRL